MRQILTAEYRKSEDVEEWDRKHASRVRAVHVRQTLRLLKYVGDDVPVRQPHAFDEARSTRAERYER